MKIDQDSDKYEAKGSNLLMNKEGKSVIEGEKEKERQTDRETDTNLLEHCIVLQ